MPLFPYAVLAASASEYLRYTQGCHLIAWERGPWEHYGHRPDVIGVEKGRRVIEIEIKRSLADFRNDAGKRIWALRERSCLALPWKFYYLVPPELVERVLDSVPNGRGLMTVTEKPSRGGNAELVVVTHAKADRNAVPLTLKQLWVMARDQSGTLVSLAGKLSKLEYTVDSLSLRT